jgi:hypothetical protein
MSPIIIIVPELSHSRTPPPPLVDLPESESEPLAEANASTPNLNWKTSHHSLPPLKYQQKLLANTSYMTVTFKV